MIRYLGVDFGGTRTRAAWFDENMIMMNRAETFSTVTDEKETVINRIIQTAQKVVPNGEIPTAIGISAPGPLDSKRGIIHHAKTLPNWENIPLAGILSQEFENTPTYLDNDANLGALAEYHMGAGKNADPMLYLTISTGIGGGCIINGKLFTGSGGYAIEPGHMQFTGVDGGHYCWEELASGTAIAFWADYYLNSTTIPSVLRDINPLTGEYVGKSAIDGDLLAQDIISQTAEWLGLGLVNLIHIFNPQVIVLGGSVIKLGNLVLAPAKRVIHERILSQNMYDAQTIRVAQLGDDVCLYGAVWNCKSQMMSI